MTFKNLRKKLQNNFQPARNSKPTRSAIPTPTSETKSDTPVEPQTDVSDSALDTPQETDAQVFAQTTQDSPSVEDEPSTLESEPELTDDLLPPVGGDDSYPATKVLSNAAIAMDDKVMTTGKGTTNTTPLDSGIGINSPSTDATDFNTATGSTSVVRPVVVTLAPLGTLIAPPMGPVALPSPPATSSANDDSDNVLAQAIRAARAGLSVVEIKAGTKSPNGGWKVNQTVANTPFRVAQWTGLQAFALIGGAISGGQNDQGHPLYLTCFDFDVAGYRERFEAKAGALADRLAVQRTGSGNYQMLFRSPLCIRNEKLAWAPNEDEDTGREIAIETRGEGGYFLFAPSFHPSGNRYRMVRGDIANLPILSEEEAQSLFDIAQSLDDAPRTRQQVESDQKRAEKAKPAFYEGSRRKKAREVIDAYNALHDVGGTLERFDYTPVGDRYARPGGQNGSVIVNAEGYSVHFNSNDPLSDGRGHAGFDVVCYFEYENDFKAALEAAAKETGIDLRDESAEVQAKRDARLAELLEEAEERGVPQIQTRGRGMHLVLQEMQSAIEQYNAHGPRIFCSSGSLAQLVHDPERGQILQPFDDISFLGQAAHIAQWVGLTTTGMPVETFPEGKCCSVFLRSPNQWKSLPVVNTVAVTPFFDKTGTLCAETGYYTDALTYLQLEEGFQLPDATPTPANVMRTIALIQQLLDAIDFVDEASRAHALALMLQPLVRRLIRGATPLYLYDAPSQSSGKSYAATVAIAVHGKALAMNDAKSHEEWEKTLFTAFLEGRLHLFIDNITSNLSSSALASYITEEYKTQRFLGKNQSGTVYTRNASWVGTSNNATLSADAASRIVKIRIDPNMVRPSERVYEHDPEFYILENRAQVVGALLTLINNWMAQGRPLYQGRPHRFKQWSQIMGGILQANGIPGFLGNLVQAREEMDPTLDALRNFVAEWYQTHGEKPQPSARLRTVALRSAGMLGLIGNDEQTTRKLGDLLFAKRDNVFEVPGIDVPLKIRRVEKKHTVHGALWYLQPLGTPTTDEDANAEGDTNSDGDADKFKFEGVALERIESAEQEASQAAREADRREPTPEELQKAADDLAHVRAQEAGRLSHRKLSNEEERRLSEEFLAERITLKPTDTFLVAE